MRQQRQYRNFPNPETQRKSIRTNGRTARPAADPAADHWSRNGDTGYGYPGTGTDDISTARPGLVTLAHAPTNPADTANPAPPIGTDGDRNGADQHANAADEHA